MGAAQAASMQWIEKHAVLKNTSSCRDAAAKQTPRPANQEAASGARRIGPNRSRSGQPVDRRQLELFQVSRRLRQKYPGDLFRGYRPRRSRDRGNRRIDAKISSSRFRTSTPGSGPRTHFAADGECLSTVRFDRLESLHSMHKNACAPRCINAVFVLT